MLWDRSRRVVSDKMRPILHIPHASVAIPQQYRKTYLGGDAVIDRENLKLCDLHTDTLFLNPALPAIPLIFPYSRIFVDVERFRDAKQEIMAGRGMGALYTHGHKLEPIRNKPSPAEQEWILRRYYDPHHAKLTELVDAELVQHGKALIIDCHSFPSKALPYEVPNERPRSEICIGTDPFHTPQSIANCLSHVFEKKGYHTAQNYPFAGSLVPMKHYQKNPHVLSVMLEIRRDLFSNEKTGSKTGTFKKIQLNIKDALESLVQEINCCTL